MESINLKEKNFTKAKISKRALSVIIILLILLVSSITYTIILSKKNKECFSEKIEILEAANDFVKIYANLLNCYKESLPYCNLTNERTGVSAIVIPNQSSSNLTSEDKIENLINNLF